MLNANELVRWFLFTIFPICAGYKHIYLLFTSSQTDGTILHYQCLANARCALLCVEIKLSVCNFLNIFSNFKLSLNENLIVIERDCKMSLRSSSQQPSGIWVKCDRLQL